MTDTEKRMKKYTNAVERRLNLPRDIKARVMSDFISAITARRESGMTDEEIYAELGTPSKAAADLNEQMKEFTYRKSPWRFLFAGLAVYGGIRIIDKIWTYLVVWWVTGVIQTREAASIGIIGGADGPTSIFVTTPAYTHWVIPAVLLALGIWGFYRLSRCKRK